MAEGIVEPVTYTCRICGAAAYCEIGLKPTCWAEAISMGRRSRPYKHGVCGECARPDPYLSRRSGTPGQGVADTYREGCSKEFPPAWHTVKGWFRARTYTLTWNSRPGCRREHAPCGLELLLIVSTWGPNPTSAHRVEQAREAAAARVVELRGSEGRQMDLFALASHRTLCCRKHAQAELRHMSEAHGTDQRLLTSPLDLPYEDPLPGSS